MPLPNHGQCAATYLLPVLEKYVLYSPRTGFAALINAGAAAELRRAAREGTPLPDSLSAVAAGLDRPAVSVPAARADPLVRPAFLGLVVTRGCNLACRYCDFPPPDAAAAMTPALARRAVDGYLRLLGEQDGRSAEIHFFGGEPLFARETVQFAVEYALSRAAGLGIGVRFEVTTNGVFCEDLCRWVGDRIDSIVLSLDGPQDIQDRQRPAAGGRSAFAIVNRNAKILSDSPAELVLRACVSGGMEARMEEIADWMAAEYRPDSVCFEPLSESDASRANGLLPPDPWAFAAGFHRASAALERRGIRAVAASAEMDECRATSCPLGNDALIVSPAGAVDACYLPAEDWRRVGIELHLGSVGGDGLRLDEARIQAVRDLAAREKPLCAGCFCRFHCAGGCHVRHNTTALPGAYDAFCIHTRLIALTRLLRRLDAAGLADRLIGDRAAMECAALQPNDSLHAEDALS